MVCWRVIRRAVSALFLWIWPHLTIQDPIYLVCRIVRNGALKLGNNMGVTNDRARRGSETSTPRYLVPNPDLWLERQLTSHPRQLQAGSMVLASKPSSGDPLAVQFSS